MRKSEIDLMGFENGRITGFKPRFHSIGHDWERYTEALVELVDRGVVAHKKGHSLYDLYCQDLNAWLTEFYFEEKRFDQIEAHYTHTGEVAFGPILEEERAVLDRLQALGEGARVRRIWRAHMGLIKREFWWYIGERNAGFRMAEYYQASEQKQRRDYEKLINRIPKMKQELLAIMADYRKTAEMTGASKTELARIHADIAAIDAEERPRPKGKPDPRKMDENLFWDLIDEGLTSQPIVERIDTLPERLAAFKATAIRDFEKIRRSLEARAYRWDVWALAYLLQGGCSDDAFENFRGWLVLQGREVFEGAIADPDSFDVTLHSGTASGINGLRDAAPVAYEMRQGKAMKPVKMPLMDVSGPEIAEDDFASALPRVAALVGR
ncbi:DUF4240 domain-containing protein [Loktanella sp. TSTF-M6]|uniref:DUF4240 domain-containing protein n=1 Tax=Loktanella gaetbuli TaxID=2881335 RepID=A0ABS8BRZ8_9RHOB|nr:DUF4240 domain-containing protein [Loktanella gaetbuli]MCB5198512.1 DUF4240 domain-containing protein [Loktanella gaetbuli]